MRVDDKAACSDKAIDPEIFHPPVGETQWDLDHTINKKLYQVRTVEALEICAICPVKRQCLEYSFEELDTTVWGVYGGFTPDERLTMAGLRTTRTPGLAIETVRNFYQPVRQMATERGVPIPEPIQIGELNWEKRYSYGLEY